MSPRTKEQNEEIRRQRQQEILQAAMRVYVEKGYAASEVSDIADRAGLAHGLVFYYFKNKKNLFRALYEHMMEESRRYTDAFFAQDRPVLELLETYARIVCERVLENPVMSRFYMRISHDIHFLYTPDEISPFDWVKGFMLPMTRTIDRGIAEGEIRKGDAHLMAMQFWGSVSQGMAYLDQSKQEMEAQGIPDAEVKIKLTGMLHQIVDSSVSLIKGG
ncbi:TetR/AcrR family transcriptional regulator [Paenibacillus cellulositrophicus]|uniref:TetR/AcrR family transcriptional regulator n=1 Tax=Paenibacillus cellulositrophicus TaxID=562959 RepID=UPI00203F7008|nr:TetR/AcrR family transcriptional regulator [Paenibacillus cellulositrophicus]MCM2998958.1 TetR/AcrR family transcriptional regulator [Paenibacillus cellulositrophicus]